MSILLFGAGGQVGQELTALAAARGVALTGVTRQDADIADAEAVRAAIARVRPSILINAAAYTKVDKAESEVAAATRANATGPGVLATVAAAAGLPLVHLSTDYVFDGSKDGAYTESDPVAPLGVYGVSKEAGERAVRAALPQHIILRTSWVYGLYGANFLKTILRLAGERDELRIVADQHGNPTATADIAEALLTITDAVAAGGPVPWGTYHFAGSGDTTWHGFAAAIVAAMGKAVTVTPITTADYPTPARRPANSRLDSRRFAAAFGLTAHPWPQRTAEAVAALKAQTP